MKNLKKLSAKAIEFCKLSGYDIDLIKENMKSDSFAFQICETKEEMENEGVDYNYPYVIFNPFNLNIQ